MKYIKLFENFNNDILEDAKWIVISHLGEVDEIKIDPKWNPKNLLMFNLLEEPSSEQIESCREHLKEEGFFLDDPGFINTNNDICIVGIGNSVKEYCINWLNDNFSGLEAVPSKSFPNTILYRHDLKDNILLYDKTNNKVYVNYQKIYAFFEHYFDLDEKEILDIIELWISETYNLNLPTTRFGNYYGRFEKCE